MGGGVGRRGADISAFLYLEVWTTMSIIQIQSMKIEIACSRLLVFVSCILYSPLVVKNVMYPPKKALSGFECKCLFFIRYVRKEINISWNGGFRF